MSYYVEETLVLSSGANDEMFPPGGNDEYQQHLRRFSNNFAKLGGDAHNCAI